MNPLTFTYGALALGTAIVGLLAGRGDTRTVALLVAFVWATGRLSTWLLGLPAATLIYPPVDVLAATIVMSLCNQRPATWKAIIVGTFLLQLVCHVVFQAHGDAWRDVYYRYVVALNVLFLIQLGAVAGPGLWDVLGRPHIGLQLDRPGVDHSTVSRSKWPTT